MDRFFVFHCLLSVFCFLFGHSTLILQNNFLLSRLCLFCYSQEAVQLCTFLGKFKVDNIFKLDVKLFVEWQHNYTSLSTYVPSCKLSAISRLRGEPKNIRQITQFPPSRYLPTHKYQQQHQSQLIPAPDSRKQLF